MELYFDINLWAVAAAAISAQILGALWFSKILFGNLWMKSVGHSKKQDFEINMVKTYIGSFLAHLVIAYILAFFIQLAGATNSTSAIMLATIIWLGFIAMPSLSTVFYENRNLKVYLINTFYYLALIIVMSAILSALHFPN